MGLSNPKYPNLELIEYKFLQQLNNDEEFKKKLQKLREENQYIRAHHDFDVIVFSQIWGSTCTAFDICKDGSPALGGNAMTRAYTTVIKETLTGTYGVFIGNKSCYMVTNATDEFYKDLSNRNMASLNEARRKY